MHAKSFTLILLFCFTVLATLAQLVPVAESSKFEEPETGFVKILSLQNGNTAYIHITEKEGINLRIFNPEHTQIISSYIIIGFERLKEYSRETSLNPGKKIFNKEKIEHIFELGNQVVLFITEAQFGNVDLYRIIIDTETGKKIEEKKIIELDYVTSIDIKKDLYTDNYAIAYFEYLESEKKGNKKIILYGSDHKQISSWVFDSPETDKKHNIFRYKDMVIIGAEKVFAFYFATSAKDDDKGNFYMVTMQKGTSDVSFNKLSIPDELYYRNAITKYNPVNKKLVFLTISKKTSSDEFTTYLNIIDPVTKTSKNLPDNMLPEKMNEGFKTRFNKKKDYNGFPQGLFIDQDGGFSIVFEELAVQYTTSGNYTRKDTRLGKILVSKFDNNEKFVSNFIVPKAHWIMFTELELFYHSNPEFYVPKLELGNQYKYFSYVSGKNNNVIFFNDTERNNEFTKDNLTEVQSVVGCDAFMYKLSGEDLFPTRAYALVASKKEHSMILFAASDYDSKTGTYACLKLNKESSKNGTASIIWLKL